MSVSKFSYQLLCLASIERYHRAGKNLSPNCRRLLSNAGALIDVSVEEDPLYTVAGAERAY